MTGTSVRLQRGCFCELSVIQNTVKSLERPGCSRWVLASVTKFLLRVERREDALSDVSLWKLSPGCLKTFHLHGTLCVFEERSLIGRSQLLLVHRLKGCVETKVCLTL